MKTLILIPVLLLAGCMTVWMKPGSTERDYKMDTGQCRAQSYSVPNAPPLQALLVFTSCMEGKGWEAHQE